MQLHSGQALYMGPGMRRGFLFLGGFAAVALAAGGVLVPAAAQMRAGPVRGGWTAPFAPVAPGVLGGIQQLLGTPAGIRLTSELPSVQGIRTYSPASEADLRVVGAMSAHLPPDFSARLSAAVQGSRTDPSAVEALTKELGGAYRAAVPEVTQAVQARARQVAAAVAYGQIDGRELVVAAGELERFGIYGPEAQDKARIVRRLASQQLMENAQKVAADFLKAQRPSDPGPGAEDSARKPMPEDWRLRAYRKAAGLGEEGRAKAAPPEPKASPKAEPMSSDLYQRLGAVKGMKAAELEAAFKRTSELHRPERYLDRDAKSLIILTMAHRKVEEAFEILGDPAKRAEYDRGVPQKGPPAANPLSDDYYERIGATRDMSPADLKSAYRRAAAAYHPDKSRTKDEPLVKAMTKAFQDVSEAYETLSDPAKRAAYDRKPAKPSPRR
ncbi:MAG: chaperone protein DnaJ [Elusimicrobia bacterium]|nr:MAG: chaperone protein DnaJ [Elusimicrobiota bacterium]